MISLSLSVALSFIVLIDTGEILKHNDHVEEAIKAYGNEILIGDRPKSQVYIPMFAGGEVKGVISLQNLDHENAFTDSDINLITTLSNSMSVALESARLFDETTRLLKETEQRTGELAVINSVQEGLAKELDMHAIYDLVGNKLSEVLNSVDLDIREFFPEKNEVHYPYMRDHGVKIDVSPQPMIGMSKYVYTHGQTLIINKNLKERMEEMGSTLVPGTKMEKSFAAVPIMSGNTAVGMVSMSNYETEDAFSESDIRLLQTVVSAMSVALKNARLFAETTRLLKETEQRTAELAVINSVQEGLVKEVKSQGIYQLVGEKLCQLFDTQTVLIRTFDKSAQLETWQYAIEKGIRQYSEPRPLIWANRQLVATHKPILINENYVETAKKYGGTGVSIGQSPKSAVFVPMIVAEHLLRAGMRCTMC